ncbi:9604_t:CDS:2, partial [Funneliformis mosseae]
MTDENEEDKPGTGENSWSIIKGNVEKQQPKNLAELEQFKMEEWNDILN